MYGYCVLAQALTTLFSLRNGLSTAVRPDKGAHPKDADDDSARTSRETYPFTIEVEVVFCQLKLINVVCPFFYPFRLILS